MSAIDIVQVRRQLADVLRNEGYGQVDADPTDFRSPTNEIRFKIGTANREVTITAWRGPKPLDVIRVVSLDTYEAAVGRISTLVVVGEK